MLGPSRWRSIACGATIAHASTAVASGCSSAYEAPSEDSLPTGHAGGSATTEDGGRTAATDDGALDAGKKPAGHEAPASGGSGYLASSPARLLDSRDGTGAAPGRFTGKLDALAEREIDLSGLEPIFGPTSTRTGVVISATATDPESAGFLALYPCGGKAGTSTVNFRSGETASASTVIAGRLCIVSNVRTHVILDGVGSFHKGAGSLFAAVPLRRVFDSRSMTKASTYSIPITGLPVGTTGVAAHLTVTDPVAAGFATLHPCGAPAGDVSHVNFALGQTASATILSTLGANGDLCVTSNAVAHVLVDIEGSFGGGSLGFVHRAPMRVFDSRAGAAGESFEFVVPNVPVGATSVALTLVATGASADGFAAVRPCGDSTLTTSTVNVAAGASRASFTLAPLDAKGHVCVATNTPMHVIADVVGVLAP